MKLFKFVMIIALFLSLSCSSNGGWISLFDGASLDNWKIAENPKSAWVDNGVIVCNGERAHVFYNGDVNNADFKNFEFKADVKTEPGTNSGIFFHTTFQETGWPSQGYEIQVNNSQKKHGNYYEFKKTGSLYGIRNTFKAFANDNEWFTIHAKVVGKHVQIWVNDMQVVNYVEPENAPRNDARDGRFLSHGTFALQAHDPGSTAYFKNIMVKPLPDNALTEYSEAPVVDDVYKKIVALNINNFPIIDYHVHLKGGLTIDQAIANSQKNGIMYGIAPNCGVGFPIQDDQGIYDFIESMKDKPIFLGMQAEGREWVNMFSKEAISKFDYVFSDAMTFTDKQGRRTRLWMKDEVWVDDAQDFMDMYVEKIVGVVSNEPINIYVNPTFLPEVIAADYDKLWTKKRINTVVKALADNNVALEINARYKLPSSKIIKAAKEAGVKFSFGTNNVGAELGRLEYCLEMIDECGLTAEDMFLPKSVYEK